MAIEVIRKGKKEILVKSDEPIFVSKCDEHTIVLSFKPVKSVEVEWF